MSKLDFLTLDKKALVNAILDELYNIKNIAFASAEQARITATHSENTADSRYDTLGLEGAYLAHGQTQRVADCDDDIVVCKNMPVVDLGEKDAVNVGSLVSLADDEGNVQYLFLSPRAGGVKVEHQGCDVTLVTPSSPIGKALLRKFKNDEVLMVVSAQHKYFTIEDLI